MATRLYLSAAAETTGILPSFAYSGWNDTSIMARVRGTTQKRGLPMTTINFTDADSTDKNIGFRQIITNPITSGTLSVDSLISVVFRCCEYTTGADLFIALAARIMDKTGTIVRKDLMPGSVTIARASVDLGWTELDDTGWSGDVNEARFYQVAITQSYAPVAGDRLVLEIGLGGDPTGSNTHTSRMVLGDNSATDLGPSSGGTNPFNPWIELEANLTFQADPTVWIKGGTILGNTTIK